MKLLIDIGNTATKFAKVEREEFDFVSRFYNFDLTEETLDNLLSKLSKVESVYVSSVVPKINEFINRYFKEKFDIEPTYIKVDQLDKLKIKIDNINELGPDLYCDLVAGAYLYGPKTLVIDLGTASKILLIDKKATFSYCYILPGVAMSKKMLSKETALLPDVGEQEIKKVTESSNTVEVINSSTYYGHVEMICGLIRRFEKEIGYKCRHVFTGGNSRMFMKDMEEPYIYDEFLCLKGIAELIKIEGK